MGRFFAMAEMASEDTLIIITMKVITLLLGDKVHYAETSTEQQEGFTPLSMPFA